MCSVISGTGISLALMAEPHITIPARLRSIEGRHAAIALDGAPLEQGSLVRFETSTTLYLGEIETVLPDEIQVLIEHSVDLGQAAAIRRLWNTGANP